MLSPSGGDKRKFTFQGSRESYAIIEEINVPCGIRRLNKVCFLHRGETNVIFSFWTLGPAGRKLRYY
jgi:hypothetical protein